MIELKFTVASAAELQEKLTRIARMMEGVQMLNEGAAQREGLALYDNQELTEELLRRAPPEQQAGEQQAAVQAEQVVATAKGKPGRPRKTPEAAAPAAAPVAPASTATEAPADPAPQPEAVAAAKPAEPKPDEGQLAPEPLTEDFMLRLMGQLYAATGDLQLVRGLTEQVCGKPQMSECKAELYPQLKALIDAELVKAAA